MPLSLDANTHYYLRGKTCNQENICKESPVIEITTPPSAPWNHYLAWAGGYGVNYYSVGNGTGDGTSDDGSYAISTSINEASGQGQKDGYVINVNIDN